jgi:hypothetical protein
LQRRLRLLRTEAVDGLKHAAPGVLHQIVSIENQGDRYALAGGQSPEGPLVVRDHAHLGADLGFCVVHDGGLGEG